MAGKELGNRPAYGPLDTPIRADKLPIEALRQLTAKMTLTAPHHPDEDDIPLHHDRHTSSK